MVRVGFVLVGEESLLVQCGELLRERGHEIALVVSQTQQIMEWAQGAGISTQPWTGELADILRPVSFDWLLSIANLKLIPGDALRLARAGAINFHDGPLPRYAGLNTPSWAILEGAASHGVTWHAITEEVDAGDVFAEKNFEIEADDTALMLNAKCFDAGLSCFAHLVGQIESGRLEGRPQPSGERRLYRRNDRPENAGILDFAGSAAAIDRIARALDFGSGYANPLVTAKIETSQGIYAVSSLKVLPEAASAQPGSILVADAGGIVVAARDGQIRVAGSTLDGRFDLGGRERAGDVLPEITPEFRERIGRIVAATVPHEAYWREALANVSNIDTGWTGDKAPSRGETTASIPRTGGADDDVALLVAFLARFFGQSGLSVMYSDDTLARTAAESRLLVAGAVPWSLELDLDREADEFVRNLGENLAALRKRQAHLTDVFLRYPGLQRPKLAVGLVATADVDTAMAIPDCAVTIVIGGAGRVRLLLDTAQCSLAEGSEFARRLAIFAEAFGRGGQPVGDMPVMDGDEWRDLVENFNETAGDHDSLCLHELVEKQARLTPDAVAVAFRDREISYRDLDTAADAVAVLLRGKGVGPDMPVGLHVRRSIELVIGALAILKAGGAYVPLDPDFPTDRLALMLEDSGAGLVLTERALPPIAGDTRAISIDIADAIATGAGRPEPSGVGPHSLAYVIYTSGSTGRPKGVMIEHRNVANFFAGMDGRIDRATNGQPVWLAVTSLSFDISVLELFWTLARGFKVVIHASEIHRAHDAGAVSLPAAVERKVEFGLFYWGNDDGVGSNKYRLLFEGAKFADAHGFEAIWTPERHFHAFGGPYPNPSVTGAAVAALTSRLSIRAGSCVLPLHHPARVVEEWAVVDNMCGGRVALAFASGWMPEDFVLRPENAPPANKASLVRDIDIVRRLWRGEAVAFPFGDRTVDVVTQPRPVQPELPIWLTTAGNPDSYREAARLGANVLTHLLGQSVDELAEKIAIYRETLRECGRNPDDYKVTLMLHTLVGEDREEVRRLAREPMKDYLRSAAALIKQYAWAFPAFKKPAGAAHAMDIDLRDLAADEMDAILDFAFERYFEESGLFGTLADCTKRVNEVAAIGVDEVACLIDFGIASDVVLDGLRPLAGLVSLFREAGERLVAASAPTPIGFAAEVAAHRVTHMQCTPSMARMFLADEDNRRALGQIGHLMIGGEPLPASLLAELRSVTEATIENMYGPTETTIWSSTAEAEATEGVAPLGRPILNTQFYVLDRRMKPVPAGRPGELFIGGAGVARGYLGRDDLTGERFLPNPFADGRIYRTGDLVQMEPDRATLRFIGRADHQVKVRGYRIELGEIEARISSFPGISEAIALTRENKAGDVRIVGYLKAPTRISVDALRDHLAAALPDYMVPSQFVQLASFPLTPNAKVDRARLPAVEDQPAPAVEQIHVPLRDERERAIAETFARVLGLPRVGPADNFFALGGHSLLAVHAHRALKASIAPDITITDLFRFPTVAGLAAHLADRGSADQKLSSVAERAAMRRNRMHRQSGLVH